MNSEIKCYLKKIFLNYQYYLRGFSMARNRKISKLTKKKTKKEQALSLKNCYDINDPTPKAAMLHILNGGQVEEYI